MIFLINDDENKDYLIDKIKTKFTNSDIYLLTYNRDYNIKNDIKEKIIYDNISIVIYDFLSFNKHKINKDYFDNKNINSYYDFIKHEEKTKEKILNDFKKNHNNIFSKDNTILLPVKSDLGNKIIIDDLQFSEKFNIDFIRCELLEDLKMDLINKNNYLFISC